MNRTKSSSSKRSFTRAGVLLAVLAVIVLLYRFISPQALEGFIATMEQQDHKEYAKLSRFDEPQADAVKKHLGGFWQREGSSADSLGVLHILDRIELKDNGIVWRVKLYTLKLPAGDSTTIMHVSHEYFSPFAWVEQKDSVAVCETPILLQGFIVEGDTCYNEKDLERMAEIQRTAQGLLIDSVLYTAYTGELTQFFPPGALDMLNTISVTKCAIGTSVSSIATTCVGAQLATQPRPSDRAVVQGWVDHFYLPIHRAHRDWMGQRWAGTKATIALRIDSQGWVDSVEVVAPAAKRAALQHYLSGMSRLWRFPQGALQGSELVVRTSVEL
jgi:hypothetical protein